MSLRKKVFLELYNLGKNIFTNVEDSLLINKPCNINIYV